MLKDFKGDLHVHTCLSPCGSNEMLPTAIVKEAKEQNLDIIGICDHNSVENVEAVKKAGEKESMAVIGGVEITSREEVHILGLFDNDDVLQDIKRMIEQNLPGENDEEAFSYLGASLCLLALANRYAQSSSSTIGADVVDYRTKSDIYASRAKEHYKKYIDYIHPDEVDELSAAILIKEFDTNFLEGERHLTHNPDRR